MSKNPSMIPDDRTQPVSDPHEMKVAFAGCGAISALHLAGVIAQPNLRLVAVADPDFAAASALAAEAAKLSGQPAPLVFPSLRELLAACPVNTVHILTPHFTHVDLAIEALAAGCHVLVEKPVGIDPESLQRLSAAVAGSTGQLGVCLQNRYNFASQAARQLLESQQFGDVLGARAFVTWWRDQAYYLESPWRGRWSSEGGSLMINQALHTLDLLLWLAGPADTVIGHIFNDHLPGVIETEDTATAHFQLQNGATAVFYATTAFPNSMDPLLDIICEQAMIRIEGSDRITVFDRQGNLLPGFSQRVKTEEDPTAELAARLLPPDKAYWGKSHAILIADFYRHLSAGQPFALDLIEGSRALETLLAWYASSQQGHVVKLS